MYCLDFIVFRLNIVIVSNCLPLFFLVWSDRSQHLWIFTPVWPWGVERNAGPQDGWVRRMCYTAVFQIITDDDDTIAIVNYCNDWDFPVFKDPKNPRNQTQSEASSCVWSARSLAEAGLSISSLLHGRLDAVWISNSLLWVIQCGDAGKCSEWNGLLCEQIRAPNDTNTFLCLSSDTNPVLCSAWFFNILTEKKIVFRNKDFCCGFCLDRQ